MKIKSEHLVALTDAIAKVKEAHPDSTLQAYVDNGLSKERWRWDVFHASRKYLPEGFVKDLHKYLNDSHIDTALRLILKDDLAAVQSA
jgi:hypothetical protein